MNKAVFYHLHIWKKEGSTVMKKKAAAFAAALTLSAVVAAPVFAEDSSMYGTGTATGWASIAPTTTPGTGMMNWGATASPHTYSGTTGVNNYGTNDMTGTDGSYRGYGTGTDGTYHSKTYNALADTTKKTNNWGWLGLLGLLGLTGLRGKNRDDDRGVIK